MTEPVRWGVLGASDFARRQMARALHFAEGAEFYALATSSAEKAAGFQAFNPGLKILPSYEDLLADPKVEAVYIPLPNHLHVEWTLKALEAGKHVLTEKPIAMESSQIDSLIAARDASGKFATEAYMIVQHPQWQRARQLYREGAIGKMLHVSGMFAYDSSSAPDNIRNRPETGGGGIPDIGVYTYGSTRWVSGEEAQEIICADIEYENGVDVMARVTARFETFSAQWMNSMRVHPVQEMNFLGETGILRLTAPFNANIHDIAVLELHRNTPENGGQTLTVERFAASNHYINQVEAFGRHIREGDPYPWTLEDARGTQTLIEAVYAKGNEAD